MKIGDLIKYSEERTDGKETDHLLESALHLVKDTYAKFEEEKRLNSGTVQAEKSQ